jgi:ATP-dependent DNA helicase RecQ
VAPPETPPLAAEIAATPKAAVSEDSSIVALKVLSCVLRAKEQLGRGKIAKILAGSEDASVQDFRTLTTYGILSTHPIRAITESIDDLIAEGYIHPGEGLRPVIGVTSKGRQFLKDRVLKTAARAGSNRPDDR